MRVSSTARSNFSGMVGEARRQEIHEPRHRQHGERGQEDENERQPGGGFLGEAARGVPALRFELVGEQRYERRIESALAKETPEEVRKPEGDVETSATGPVPSTAAARISRTNPRTRLRSVKPPTVANAR